jgi:predicted short-subunit dehydrogenase-like oxidoreductase (DUF2520 family)
MQTPTLGFIGAGKVGHTLARLWYGKGFTIRAVYSPTMNHARALADQVGADVAEFPAGVVLAADLTLLTVPDDHIETVAALLASELDTLTTGGEKGVVHTSGAQDISSLSALSGLGMMVGGLHPAYPFADVESAVHGLPGATFGLETNSDILRGWLVELVNALDGRVFAIPTGSKALYHSAFVFASNYAVTLYAIAEKLLLDLGADRDVADNALNALLVGTVENLRRQGVPDALTGPLVRSDMQTVERHLQALDAVDGNLVDLYKQLAQLSLPMLAARHVDTFFIEEYLNRE